MGSLWSASRCWWARYAGWLGPQEAQHPCSLFSENLGCWTLVEDNSVFQTNDFGVEDERLLDVVGDGEDGDAVLCGVKLHAGKEDVAQGAIDAGEGFVEEEEVWRGNGEGAGEIDALALASGEIAGKAVGEWDELE